MQFFRNKAAKSTVLTALLFFPKVLIGSVYPAVGVFGCLI